MPWLSLSLHSFYPPPPLFLIINSNIHKIIHRKQQGMRQNLSPETWCGMQNDEDAFIVWTYFKFNAHWLWKKFTKKFNDHWLWRNSKKNSINWSQWIFFRLLYAIHLNVSSARAFCNVTSGYSLCQSSLLVFIPSIANQMSLRKVMAVALNKDCARKLLNISSVQSVETLHRKPLLSLQRKITLLPKQNTAPLWSPSYRFHCWQRMLKIKYELGKGGKSGRGLT